MMLSAASPASVARSSLEEMLDSLRRKDECEKPRDLPPALPARPTSRGRLPPARRSLPVNFEIGRHDPEDSTSIEDHTGSGDLKRKEDTDNTSSSFGSKRLKSYKNGESPYASGLEVKKDDMVDLGFIRSYSDSVSSPATKDSEWNDNIDYFIKKKLSIWCRVANRQWASGIIISTVAEDAVVKLSKGNTVKVSIGGLLPANPDVLEGVEDLIQLSYLNEPSVLHNLEHRYSKDLIYSKAGPVLIALNPFKNMELYGNDTLTAYRHKVAANPHAYAVANTAYNEMIRDEVNQSIVISGESGAGKTETAKIVLQYLTAVGGGSGSGMEHEILRTTCILEAFGNAKTSRNDNSSRFGKFIAIHFGSSGKICSAQIQTFLLEKSRVVQLAKGERTYHVFYQLCAGAPLSLKERLNLKSTGDYNYLNQSSCLKIDGVDDAKLFNVLVESLDVIRIPREEQESIFAIVAAVLWLGNISFNIIDNESHVEVVDDEAFRTASRLLGCAAEDMMVSLSTRKIKVRKDSIPKKLTLQQANDTRDALAKFLYVRLFDYLVEQINKSLAAGTQLTGKSINILDIYGFQSFEKNSFEQFCINYANERLQQHFNRHLFKLEQEDYEVDGIDLKKVDFEDNEDCLNLIEKKPLGLLCLLDEESKFPKATDQTFVNKLKQHLKDNPCLKAESSGAFSIRHYAREVQYDASGFLEKNRDPLHSDFIEILSSSRCQMPRLFASNTLNTFSADLQKQSVATKFKVQLFKLMNQLESTRPHFIRCIKPNNKKLPGLYDKDLVLEQLKSCGILEVVRISRFGYPTRMTHTEFAERYGIMLLDANVPKDPLSASVSVLQQLNVLPEMYQVGYTKLYLRNGQIASLEDKRTQFLQGIVRVQKYFRGHQVRHNFHELKDRITILQSFARGEIARREYNILLERRVSALEEANQHKHILYIQSAIRGWLSRRKFSNLHMKKKPTIESLNHKPKDASREELPVVLTDLQKRVQKAETALEEKEEENAALRDQLRQYDKKWFEYEARMKSMEETWQKQMASLQMSLAAARKSLAPEDNTAKPRRYTVPTSPQDYDSEDATSGGSQTPGGSLQTKFSNDVRTGRETNGTLNTMSDLMREFEIRKQTFDEDVKAISEVKSEVSDLNTNPDEELKKLKARFESWKKDYKVRLKETKVRIHKRGFDSDRSRRKWWAKKR